MCLCVHVSVCVRFDELIDTFVGDEEFNRANRFGRVRMNCFQKVKALDVCRKGLLDCTRLYHLLYTFWRFMGVRVCMWLCCD